MQIAKEYIRQNILNAALPLFYAKGYSKVTIREIADDSHVGLSNIYNYYNSKEDIFRELVQPVINDFEIMLDKHHGKSGSDIMEMYTEHYLRAVIAEYISLIKKYRNLLFLLLFRSQGTSLENYKRDFADRSTEVVKEYFRNMKIKHPELNINISEFTIHLHTVWMFTMLEELIMHKKVSDEIEQIITEYMIFSTTGWRELMKG
ncbi:TetR/AcrR family transcriptional regulator [Barnesiella intestinihominis]|uniref:TetR/AcrR family transcriptional regulator n=1 Tax=Barnesiella intestinihominis TaxID=487174 RepID=UPI0026745DAA|nr:TetR/AcrR family transcriptional regulator [Barnesiella intestinihominis]